MKRKNFPHRKELRQVEAQQRKEAYSGESLHDRYERVCKNFPYSDERLRLENQLRHEEA